MTKPWHSPATAQYVKERLVNEDWQKRCTAAIARSEGMRALQWQKRTRKGEPYWLHTPYGKLEVWMCFPGYWNVCLNGAELVHATSSRDAFFSNVPAAQAAGLLHTLDGFGDATQINDDLRWDIRWHAQGYPVLGTAGNFPVDLLLSDGHEYGTKQLDRLLNNAHILGTAPDKKLLLDIETVARSWQLPPPTWTKRSHGCFHLNTPYGTLIVRRLIGWTLERNGVPLCWIDFDRKVIFDKLEHAKMSALVHARDIGYDIPDGTTWIDEPAIFNKPQRDALDRSAVDGENHHGMAN
jgi:hypothetical protein